VTIAPVNSATVVLTIMVVISLRSIRSHVQTWAHPSQIISHVAPASYDSST
jgi:hypothetical protein